MEYITLDQGAHCDECGRYWPPGSQVRRYGNRKTIYCVGDHQPQGQASTPAAPAGARSPRPSDPDTFLESIEGILEGIRDLVREYINLLKR